MHECWTFKSSSYFLCMWIRSRCWHHMAVFLQRMFCRSWAQVDWCELFVANLWRQTLSSRQRGQDCLRITNLYCYWVAPDCSIKFTPSLTWHRPDQVTHLPAFFLSPTPPSPLSSGVMHCTLPSWLTMKHSKWSMSCRAEILQCTSCGIGPNCRPIFLPIKNTR